MIRARSQIVFLFSSSLLALFAVYLSQYFFNLQPCILCLYQRIPFIIIAAITCLALIFFLKKEKYCNIIIIISLLLLFFNMLLALYHVGVENGLFIFSGCGDLLANIDNINDLKEQIYRMKAIRCDEAQFLFLNISMAGWNAIYCLGIISGIILKYRIIKA